VISDRKYEETHLVVAGDLCGTPPQQSLRSERNISFEKSDQGKWIIKQVHLFDAFKGLKVVSLYFDQTGKPPVCKGVPFGYWGFPQCIHFELMINKTHKVL
jgi:hypothetical protein